MALSTFAARVPLRAVTVAALLVLTAAGGWLWLRDSSFVRVRDVYILGVSSSDEQAIRSVLRNEAAGMSTLHLEPERLRSAVERFPSVADLRARADFPHTLTIEVVEREPVAVIAIGGERVPVGAGGLVMRGVRAEADLPTLQTRRLSRARRLSDPRSVASVAVLAAAPDLLRRRVGRVRWGPKGLTLDLRSGPDLVFGSQRQARAKWSAAARVLAEPSAAGAVYLDVRVPERVAAGGLQAVGEPAQPNPQPQPENTITLNP